MAGPKCVDVRVRIEPVLKNKAQAILEVNGWTLSAAMRIFLRAVVANNGLPLHVLNMSETPNARTEAAIAESRAKARRRINHGADLIDNLEKIQKSLKESIGEIPQL
jgi:addiction module RelB/DinJ family antitoxin